MKPNGRCAVCRHPQRYRVELGIAAGVALQALGKRYGIERCALDRHKRRHLSEERRAQLVAGPVKLHELVERAAEAGLSLIDYSNLLLSVLLSQLTAAAEAADLNGTALLAGRVTDVLRLQAQLSGELARAGATITTNVAVFASPLLADLEAVIVRALEPHPEAAEAVLAGIKAFRDRVLNAARAQAAPLLPREPAAALKVEAH